MILKKNKNSQTSREQLILKFIYFFAIILFLYKSRLFILEPRIWAEEGSVYLNDALLNGFKSLFSFHQGYYSIIPSVTFYISTLFDYKYIPYFSLFASLSVWVALFVLIKKMDNPTFKILLFISLFVLLNQYQQLFLNTINLQFITPLILLVFLQNDLKNLNKKNQILLIVIIFIALFNGVLGIVLLPYLAYKLIVAKLYKTLLFSITCIVFYAFFYFLLRENIDGFSLSNRIFCNLNLKHEYWQKNQVSFLKIHYYILFFVASVLFFCLKRWEIAMMSLICFVNFCFIDMTKLCSLQITERYRVYLYTSVLIFSYHTIHKYIHTKLLYIPTLIICIFYSKLFFDTTHSYCEECSKWSVEYKKLYEGKKAKTHPYGWEVNVNN